MNLMPLVQNGCCFSSTHTKAKKKKKSKNTHLHSLLLCSHIYNIILNQQAFNGDTYETKPAHTRHLDLNSQSSARTTKQSIT
jgi:hypothetical protein